VSAPSGTVTFLFTDIEGSTRLWQQDEQSMRTALSRHDEILRKAVADHDGTVFSSMGDGIAAAFLSASAAVDAAVGAPAPRDPPSCFGTGGWHIKGEYP
jgi:class 3 adenylate cyclase